MTNPWLLLDVDGVINPLGRGARGSTLAIDYTPYGSLLVAEHVPGLLARAAAVFRLAWCTSWQDDANTYVSPLIGLPTLPVVPVPMIGGPMKSKAAGVAEWLQALRRSGDYAPVAWLDDEFDTAPAGAIPAEVHQVPVDYRQGLLAEHLDQAITLARAHA